MDEIKLLIESLSQGLSSDEKLELVKLIKKSKNINKLNQIWKPEIGEGYYYIDSENEMHCRMWHDTDHDNYRYSIGNCAPIPDIVRFYQEKQSVRVALEQFAKEYNDIDLIWDDLTQKKYCIGYDIMKQKIVISAVAYAKFGDVYFCSEEVAWQAIDAIGVEKIKKYYLGVKD